MNKAAVQVLVEALAKKRGMKKSEAERLVSMLFEVIVEGLERDKLVKINGLGTFKLVDVRSRSSVNIKDGKRMNIDAYEKIAFTPDADLRDLVNRPFAHFETVILNEHVQFSDLDEDAIGADEEKELLDDEKPSREDVGEEMEPEEGVEDCSTDEEAAEEVDEEEKTLAKVIEMYTGSRPNTGYDKAKVRFSEVKGNELKEAVDERNIDKDGVKDELAGVANVSRDVENVMIEKSSIEEKLPGSDGQEMDQEEETCEKRHFSWCKHLLWSLLLLAIGFGLGYFTRGNFKFNETLQITVNKQDKVFEKNKEEKKEGLKAKAIKPEAQPQQEVKSEVVEQKTTESTEQKTIEDQYAEINTKDARVRLGAYRIVGVADEVTVVKGQTLKSISKAHLGPDMECYVEAINGVKEVKAGDKLKIPKLKMRQLKKKRER